MGPDNAEWTINAARHPCLTDEEFVPFLAIYYYLSQFIDCPSGDSSIAATIVQRRDRSVFLRKDEEALAPGDSEPHSALSDREESS